MSRIYVKNLSKHVNEECLREHFGKIGQINDVKLKYKNGTFRGFCFIGYETTEFAEQACKQLNNTHFKKSTITVELAKNCSSESFAQLDDKKWSFESAIEKWNEQHIVKLWMTNSKPTKNKLNVTKSLRKPMVLEFLKPLVPKNIYIPRKMKKLAYIVFNSRKELLQAIQKDNSFIGGNRVNLFEQTAETSQKSSEGISPWHVAEKKLEEAKPVSETAKIFVRNLSYTVTEDELKEFFEKIGPIRGLSLPICRETLKPKGFAHVAFMFPDHAVKALNMDGTDLKGRLMHIIPSNLEEEEEIENIPIKKKKDKELKAKASSWHSWNMLFLGSNAVMKITARNSDTSKLNMLEERDPNFATNLAVQETHIVHDTKQFLEDNGVALDAFSNPAMERSCKVILAKNLPKDTTADELHERFSKFGDINRILLPEYGLTAIIEFMHQDHAATAFKKLAYRQFKYLPFYLEWAPIQIFKKEDNSKNKQDTENTHIKPEEQGKPLSEEILTELDNTEPEANATLYVKNLNFSTTEETLKEYFSYDGNVHSTLIAKQRGLSQGYGFVQYYKSSQARKAHLKFQGCTLEGHNLLVEMSKKIIPDEPTRRRPKQDLGNKTTAKIMVRNIPFQATNKEIKDIFKPFGILRTVRLPLKYGQDGEHRGFCFVDFATIEDAERAFNQLSASTHLYGRRLVLEWAKQDESLEELMQKTAERFMVSGPQQKKLKLDMDEYGF